MLGRSLLVLCAVVTGCGGANADRTPDADPTAPDAADDDAGAPGGDAAIADAPPVPDDAASDGGAAPAYCYTPGGCQAGEWCDYTPDSCGGRDVIGMCMPVPGACIDIYDPVCACDGMTYSNACYAAMAGWDVLHMGACP